MAKHAFSHKTSLGCGHCALAEASLQVMHDGGGSALQLMRRQELFAVKHKPLQAAVVEPMCALPACASLQSM